MLLTNNCSVYCLWYSEETWHETSRAFGTLEIMNAAACLPLSVCVCVIVFSMSFLLCNLWDHQILALPSICAIASNFRYVSWYEEKILSAWGPEAFYHKDTHLLLHWNWHVMSYHALTGGEGHQLRSPSASDHYVKPLKHSTTSAIQ